MNNISLRNPALVGVLTQNSVISLIPVEAAFISNAQFSSATAGANTLSAVSLGTAHTDRLMIVTVHYRSSSGQGTRTATCSIGGVSAALLARKTSLSSDWWHVEVYAAIVPTGTTGDIVVTLSGSGTWLYAGWYRTVGYSITPLDTALIADATSTIDIGDAGLLIGSHVDGTSGPGSTWTGLADENYDVNISPQDDTVSGAMEYVAAAEVGRTVACTEGVGTSSNTAIVSFVPILGYGPQ